MVAPKVDWMALQMVFVKVEMMVDLLVVQMESLMGMKMASSSAGQMVVQWVVQ
jgi:ABC-type xylose transport system permease subunit